MLLLLYSNYFATHALCKPAAPIPYCSTSHLQLTPTIFTFYNILVSVKLKHKNYTIWKNQILKILCSLELDSYVIDDLPNKLLMMALLILNTKFGQSQMECSIVS